MHKQVRDRGTEMRLTERFVWTGCPFCRPTYSVKALQRKWKATWL